MLLKNFTYGTPGSHSSSAPIQVLVKEPMLSLSPGGAVNGPGEEAYPPPQNKMLLYIITHRTPGSQNSSDTAKVLVMSLCRVSARGAACVKCGGK